MFFKLLTYYYNYLKIIVMYYRDRSVLGVLNKVKVVLLMKLILYYYDCVFMNTKNGAT